MNHQAAGGLRAYPALGDGLWSMSQAIFPRHVRSALHPTPVSSRILMKASTATLSDWAPGA
jgi:hypothetical protein